MNLNCRFSVYDDLDELKQAIPTVHDVLGTDTTIHVCDGRYRTFPGDHDLTPGLREYCDEYAHVHYHAPPDDKLPFGHDIDAPDEYRPGNHAKARWINYDVLPQDEWSLKLDADERLRSFVIDTDALDERTRYLPEITLHGDVKETVNVERLWVPEHWTCWIDDCLLPREVFPRDTRLEVLQRVWRSDRYRVMRTVGIGFLPAVTVDNVGAERDEAYQARRVEHLRTIDRMDRWADVNGRLTGSGTEDNNE